MTEDKERELFDRLIRIETKMTCFEEYITTNGRWRKHIPLAVIVSIAIITDQTNLIPLLAKLFGG